MTTILLVGAADTGRAPMAAALLRRLAAQSGWSVESAGVLGHDGSPAETEARDTMVHMGLDIGAHEARSLADDMVDRAALIVTIDGGTALVVRARYPQAAARVHTLGELAGRKRDLPDPFRMQIGAWMTYAREIESLLQTALPRIAELAGTSPGPALTPAASPATASAPAMPAVAPARAASAERIAQLLQLGAQMPDVLDWSAARGRLEQDLDAIAAAPAGPADLVAAYVGLLRAGLALIPPAPTAGQFAALGRAAAHLADPIDQGALTQLSLQLPTLPTL
jgi:protein-tyrosine-phosphatase